MRIIYFFILFFLVVACGEKKSSDKFTTTTISGQKFKNPKAEELNSRGIESSKDGKYDLAEKLFNQSLEIEPNNPVTLSNIGSNYEVQRKYQVAIEYYKESLVVSDSMYLISAANLGRLYYEIENYSDGIKILDFAIENSTENSLLTVAYISRGFSHSVIGNCEKAKSDPNFAKDHSSSQKEIDFQINRLEKRIKNCVQQNLL